MVCLRFFDEIGRHVEASIVSDRKMADRGCNLSCL